MPLFRCLLLLFCAAALSACLRSEIVEGLTFECVDDGDCQSGSTCLPYPGNPELSVCTSGHTDDVVGSEDTTVATDTSNDDTGGTDTETPDTEVPDTNGTDTEVPDTDPGDVPPSGDCDPALWAETFWTTEVEPGFFVTIHIRDNGEVYGADPEGDLVIGTFTCTDGQPRPWVLTLEGPLECALPTGGEMVCVDPNDSSFTLTFTPTTDPGPCSTDCATLANVSSAFCVLSYCYIDICSGDFDDCNRDPSDGCEVDLINEPIHCGACDLDCSFEAEGSICDTGVCVDGNGDCSGDGTCTCPGTFDNCDGYLPNGCETDVAFDDLNCGSCGNDCTVTGEVCQDGFCGSPGCQAGFQDNDGDSFCEPDCTTATDGEGYRGECPDCGTSAGSWSSAASNAQTACQASGCSQGCYASQSAGDNCTFDGAINGYICISWCGPVPDLLCWSELGQVCDDSTGTAQCQ